MKVTIDKAMVEQWLRCWSLSRQLPMPVAYRSGFKVDVGYPEQQARYVFPRLNRDFSDLAHALNDPFIYLKVCAPPAKLAGLLPPRWQLQPQGYMMHCPGLMKTKTAKLPETYTLTTQHYGETYKLDILYREDGEVAASGRVVLGDGLAVYDRIYTAIGHRRKGLAMLLMRELEQVALAYGRKANCLVATEEGRLLYERLGWQLYSLYTSVVIPG